MMYVAGRDIPSFHSFLCPDVCGLNQSYGKSTGVLMAHPRVMTLIIPLAMLKTALFGVGGGVKTKLGHKSLNVRVSKRRRSG